MRLGHLVAATAMLAASLAAHADTFQYIVSAEFLGTATATFTVPSILTAPAIVAATGVGTPNVDGVEVYPTSGNCPYSSTPVTCFVIDFTNSSFDDEIYFTTDVDSVGTFTSPVGMVTITDIPGTSTSSVTPEPSSFALLGTGLLGALGVARKRFA